MPTKKTKKKKTPVKATSKKKSLHRTATEILVYFCKGNCSVSNDEIHLKKNSTLHMFALGTEVTLTFPAPSPFKGGKAETIVVSPDKFESRVIGKKDDTFEYSFDCKSCTAGTDEAVIIIDPGPDGR